MLFFAALGLIEWIFISFFLIFLVICITFDRHGRDEPKWFVLAGGLVVAAVWYWADFVFIGPAPEGKIALWDAVTSSAFWTPVLYYVGAGLLYSLLEFFLAIRKSARMYAESWKSYLAQTRPMPVLNADGSKKTKMVQGHRGLEEAQEIQTVTVKAQYDEARAAGATEDQVSAADRLTSEYLRNYQGGNVLIRAISKDEGLSIEPEVNKSELIDSITAWTTLWPVYGVNLILGDLLNEIVRVVADFFVAISGRLVKVTFANVFKF